MLGCCPFDERHNSANIAEWMVKELDDWQLNRVTEMIVSDTAANQLGIFNPDLVPDLPQHFKPSKCACHVLVTSTDSTLNQVQGLFLPGRSDSPASKTLAGATH